MSVTFIEPTGINANATFTFADVSVVGTITTNASSNTNLGNSATANFFIGNGSLLTGLPAGNTTELQFNSAGSFAGTPGITYDGANSRLSLKNYSLVANILGDSTGATTIDVSLGTYVTATTTGAITWTFTNAAASTNASGFILALTNGGAFAHIWPASVKWPSATAPTLTASGVDLLTFITDDNGTTWRGVASMIDSR